MGIKLGLVGLGRFGVAFADLFKSHPLVDAVAYCDMEKDRVKKYAESNFLAKKFNPEDCYYSLEDICKADDIDALVIITQPWLHAPQCIQAMEAGKHVYSAVPVISLPCGDEMLDWCDKIINTSQKTGMRYMLGETTFFRPDAQYCRRQAKTGAFGDYVYAEGEYMHDVDGGCNLRNVMQMRTSNTIGQGWFKMIESYKRRGILDGPMHYPTHSVSGPVCVMDTFAEKVTAYGYRNKTNDPFFNEYAFSNEFALFKMNNGATVRIAETREAAGHLGKDSETFRIVGTNGTYSEGIWYKAAREGDFSGRFGNEAITTQEMFEKLPQEVENAFKQAMNQEAEDIEALDFVPSGHGGSHPYLVHEFVSAVAEGRQPAINAWEAARYMAMGVTAHKSALKDGETLSVPDWGNAPE